MYKFDCRLSDKDYYEFNKYHMLYAKDVKKLNRLSKWFVPFFFALIIIYNFISYGFYAELIIQAVIYAFFSIIWVCTSKYIALPILKAHIKIMKKTGKMPYSPVSCMEFFDDYFSETTPESKNEYKYSAISNVVHTKNDDVYIYLNAIQAYIISNRFFESTQQREEFLKFIKGKIG